MWWIIALGFPSSSPIGLPIALPMQMTEVHTLFPFDWLDYTSFSKPPNLLQGTLILCEAIPAIRAYMVSEATGRSTAL